MIDPNSIALWWALAILTLAALGITCFLAGRWTAPKPQTPTLAPVIVAEPMTRQLAHALEVIRNLDLTLTVVKSTQIVAASPYLELDQYEAPDSVEAFTIQSLMDENQDLCEEIDRLADLVRWKDGLRARYLKALRRARTQLSAAVHVDHFEQEASLRSRGVSVAKQIAERARDLTGAINDVQAAVIEATETDMPWPEFNAGIAAILDNHRYAPALAGATP